jgi:hypothetical protein
MVKEPPISMSRAQRARTFGACNGSAVIEMALILPLLLFIIFTALTCSMGLERYLSGLQVVRYAGSMYARGTDFSVLSNQNLLLMGASGLGITAAGGNGAICLSAVRMATTGGNLEIAEHFVIGNPSYARCSTAGEVQAIYGSIEMNQRIYVVELSYSLASIIGWTRAFGTNRVYNRAFF